MVWNGGHRVSARFISGLHERHQILYVLATLPYAGEVSYENGVHP